MHNLAIYTFGCNKLVFKVMLILQSITKVYGELFNLSTGTIDMVDTVTGNW